jgi:phenylpropionate dioxygenase-like ring-hydroxylating dioxygenase large terminal subunit
MRFSSEVQRTTRATSAWPADLVDTDRREVALAVHADPEVFRRELEVLFPNTWNFVAHVSEIPEPGDYVTRYIGADPVIVTRGVDKSIRVLLNTCAHKGALLCRVDAGSATKFVCGYHGWAYEADGRFIGAPFEQHMYGSLDRDEVSLTRARVDEVAGLIFATFGEQVPPLRDYLGGYVRFLEASFDRTDGGLQVVGPPQRWILNGNWKLAAEQFSGDGYHVGTTHYSFFEQMAGPINKTVLETMYGVDIMAEGNGARCIDLQRMYAAQAGQAGDGAAATAPPAPEDILRMLPPVGLSPDLVEDYLKRAPREHVELLASIPPTLGTIFPNFLWMCTPFPDPRGRGMAGFHDIKMLRPLASDRTEVWTWVLMERDVPTEWRRMGAETRTFMLGPSGAIEQDDFEMWSRIQDGIVGPMGQRSVARYPAVFEAEPDDVYKDVSIWRGISRDNGPWGFFLRWRQLMAGELW